MEAVKTGLGLTSENNQEGTEPLSGETGKGTSTEPYDQGNAIGSSGAAPKELSGEGPGGVEGKGVDIEGLEGDRQSKQ